MANLREKFLSPLKLSFDRAAGYYDQRRAGASGSEFRGELEKWKTTGEFTWLVARK